MKKNIVYPLIAVVVSVMLASAAVLLPLMGFYNIVLPTEYFFVCYKSGDDAQSVGIVSSTVQNYGGAGYTLYLYGEYVSAVACYYSVEDAEKVSAAFFDNGIECAVYGVQVDEYALALRYRDDACRIEGALKTFCQLASIYYSLANAIDGGVIDGGSACAIMEDADAVLSDLEKTDIVPLADAAANVARHTENIGDIVCSWQLRLLQIAVVDNLMNISFV